MIDATKLVELYQRTHWVVLMQVEGLTHAESLLQLPFRGNCMNWVLGHILANRGRTLQLLEQEAVLSEDQAAPYLRGAEPLKDAENAVDFERLLEAFEISQERIQAALAEITTAELGVVLDPEKKRTLGDRLEFLHWHETYHVGQMEILRQLAGKDDSII